MAIDGSMAAVKLGPSDETPSFRREIFDPAACRKFLPTINAQTWLYCYTHPEMSWKLCVATCGEPHSRKLSLGGFRIVPKERTGWPGFSPESEALGLACGMEEKANWSRLCRVGGALGIENLDRIVGGKCVLLPDDDSRVGQSRDFEMLSFAVKCLHDFEEHSGILIITGQDLGHGIMSDGRTPSLEFLHQHFNGSVLADTSKPTGEGNFYTLIGMLRACGIDPAKAVVGLIGCGNVGGQILLRLKELSASVFIVESLPNRREDFRKGGFKVFSPEEKASFLAERLDAVVVNANGGSLDSATVQLIIKNKDLRVICGSENLAMPDAGGEKLFLQAHKLYCPTELGGMMGYLTAVEEYLIRAGSGGGAEFDFRCMYEPARKLEQVAFDACKRIIESGYSIGFEQGISNT